MLEHVAPSCVPHCKGFVCMCACVYEVFVKPHEVGVGLWARLASFDASTHALTKEFRSQHTHK